MFLITTNREAFPKVDFDIILVNTVYPGATAANVEKLITIPVEDQLREINGIAKLTSYFVG